MQPLSMQVRRAILEANPKATEELLDEYEALVVANHNRRPPRDDVPFDATQQPPPSLLDNRLKVVHNILFPAATGDK
jgi:hypothetical protein